MKKLQMIMELEMARALKYKSLDKYLEKNAKRFEHRYENEGNITYIHIQVNTHIKIFTYKDHPNSIVISVKDMPTGAELTEVIFFN